MVDLVEVVIFSCEPEDGGVGMACAGGLTGTGDGGGGFERNQERTAEESNLLAGGDDARTLSERGERGGCGGGGVLRGEETN